jgi:ABC-type multidrug transport system ATPase subunit
MIVIASIHQPSTSTLLLFDNVLLLSQGKTVYYGPPGASTDYFASLGYPPPAMISPAEYMLELTNVDFSHHDNLEARLENLVSAWKQNSESRLLIDSIEASKANSEAFTMSGPTPKGYPRNLFSQSIILLHRMALVNSHHSI